ncbi:hybrid sensor histidine kinase/response regulator [Candidatus Halobeggiatoa sp. HSG11]|nr:hybrid sensor histidine kinase/response regulator [Candidatus Halobeggiatoa sp. HSG11]
MTQTDKEENIFADDAIFADDDFADDDKVLVQDDNDFSCQDKNWKIFIVDDEKDVHQLTRFVLEDYVYQSKPLEFLSAYSATEAKKMVNRHNNIAVIFLDVVMETNDAGLKLIEYIREHNKFARIILRTGQPGYAPEKQVILKYDINDYKNKTELTDQKLFTVITSSLRAYSDIMTIEVYRQSLEDKVIERTLELKNKNETLVGMNQELINLNQEKNEFLGIAAHDLKNPLSAIQSLANLMRIAINDFPQEKIVEFATMIENSAQRLFALIQNLLDVNAIESGNTHISLASYDILPFFQTIVQNYLKPAEDKNIEVRFNFVEEQYQILADENAIFQVLDNLISNAIKYSPHGKNVYLTLSKVDNKVRCEIRDEGPGLSEKDLSKLFGKFARLTPRPTGDEHSTGLGLFIVKKLVEVMQGNVWCKSELGKGTTFIADFPLLTETE